MIANAEQHEMPEFLTPDEVVSWLRLDTCPGDPRERLRNLCRRHGLRLVPWDVTIPASKQDKELPEKLQGETAGILNWALLGCLEWQRRGLGEPSAVMKATNDYR